MQYKDHFERIYYEWDKALSKNDVDGLLALYAEDAVLESPLIPYLMDKKEGVLVGREALLGLIEVVAVRKPNLRKFYRTPYLKMGNMMMFEYPRETPEGEQMDFMEVMELNDEGLIKSHRVYWGWRGVQVIQEDAYHR